MGLATGIGIGSLTLGQALAAAGTAASIGTSIYGATQAGGGSQYIPGIIKPTPIDTSATASGLHNILSENYATSDQQFAATDPGLALGNQALIQDTTNQLAGPPSPDVSSAFTRQGVEGALGATGGGNALAGIGGAGSATQNEVARSVATNTLAKQNQDQAEQELLISENPQRVLDLTGSQEANLSAFSTQQTNEYNFANYQRELQQQAANSSGGGF